jgi:Tol biopolymer transport system component
MGVGPLPRVSSGAISVLVAIAAAPPGAAAQSGPTTVASVDSSGVLANDASYLPALSGDGRWVAYWSRATNLVAGDTNGLADVFVHDRASGATVRVSVGSGGAQGDGQSITPGMTADGRFVGFASLAGNLVPGDTNGVYDVFVHDRQTGVTERVSVSSAGAEGDATSVFGFPPRFSDDGRFVGFSSLASNLVPGDTNGKCDVFVRDRQLGLTTRVSVDSGGVQGPWDSHAPSLSADGRFVAFMSDSALVAGDTNGTTDCFVHDRQSGATSRVSLDSAGAEANGSSVTPVISGDGRWVAFDSSASNLVPQDLNQQYDVFLHDRATGETRRVGTPIFGVGTWMCRSASISSTGRYVAFDTNEPLVQEDTNGVLDVYVYDAVLRRVLRVSVDPAGLQANGQCNRPSISGDGHTIAFGSSATNLVPGDTNAIYDTYVRQVDCWPVGSYCTAGISTGLCAPRMGATGVPSASATSGFTLTCDGIDGQRNSRIFYGTSGQAALPWGPPFGSLLCVAAPLQRTPLQSSGGGAGSCDGSIAIDWLAFLAANLGALGAPPIAGTVVDAQAWYRDPGAPRGSNLSDGLEFEVCP